MYIKVDLAVFQYYTIFKKYIIRRYKLIMKFIEFLEQSEQMKTPLYTYVYCIYRLATPFTQYLSRS